MVLTRPSLDRKRLVADAPVFMRVFEQFWLRRRMDAGQDEMLLCKKRPLLFRVGWKCYVARRDPFCPVARHVNFVALIVRSKLFE
jgi:hypothetical protein